MQHAFMFQLIEITTYLFLLISLDKVIINVLTKHATCILDKITISVLTKSVFQLIENNNLFVFVNFFK